MKIPPLIEADFDQLATLSHEFIHAWNAERIRPHRLEPFDFEQANMSLNLWFMEGFTSYYGPLAIRRAGESTTEEYVEATAYSINTVTYSPGRSFASTISTRMYRRTKSRARAATTSPSPPTTSIR